MCILFFYFFIFSEPPDVGNWFSSYEYWSPDRDYNFTLDESASREGETEIDEQQKTDWDQDEEVVREKLVQCSETRVQDDNHNEELCLTKVYFLLKFPFLNLKQH